jgi:hypothetical protein
MSRSADYTIQGFMYQFMVTLSKILLSTSDTVITVEGVVEDIDIVTPSGIEAFQCKYHETKTKFTLSAIYKPVLQMLCHFKNNPLKDVSYRLHAHFPNESVGTSRTMTDKELDEILETKAADLQTYIKQLSGFSSKSDFLRRFEIHFGHAYLDTENDLITALTKEGFSKDDATDIFYPNAIHAIAEISTLHNVGQRKLRKSEFMSRLKEKKQTAISRWTRELESYQFLLVKRKGQLRTNLNLNSRTRGIIIDKNYLKDFDSKAVQFIEDFVNKYNSKIRLNQPPTIGLIASEEELNDVWHRLSKKNITVERGYIAGKMDVQYFLRVPMKMIKESRTEFKVRVFNYNADFAKIAPIVSFDDLIVLSDKELPELDQLIDVNCERLETPHFNELRYLLSLNSTI